MKKVLLPLSILGLALAQEPSQVNPRVLFKSTAGSEVYIEQSQSEEQSPKTTARAKAKTKKESPTAKVSPHLGMYVEVYSVKEGRNILVDPKRYAFSSGERFKVKVYYNSPGVVEFINVDPNGKVSYLGKYVLEEPFSGTMLPADGSFVFVDTKGKEKLIINFYPCRVDDKNRAREVNTASSRGIALVKDEEYKNTSFKVNLPTCNIEERQPQQITVDTYVASARGITVVEEVKEKRTYYFMSGDKYVEQDKVQPIIAVLELIHK